MNTATVPVSRCKCSVNSNIFVSDTSVMIPSYMTLLIRG